MTNNQQQRRQLTAEVDDFLITKRETQTSGSPKLKKAGEPKGDACYGQLLRRTLIGDHDLNEEGAKIISRRVKRDRFLDKSTRRVGTFFKKANERIDH